MYNTVTALLYFSLNNFTLDNDNMFELLKKIKPEDKSDWDFDFIENDRGTFLYNSVLGNRRYLLHESDDTLPQARAHTRKMLIIEKIVWTIFYMILAYFLLHILFKYIAL